MREDDGRARLNLGLLGGATNCANEPGFTLWYSDGIAAIQAARVEYAHGETVTHDAIDWN